MSADIRPFSVVQSAEFADADRKREATALAIAALAGIATRRVAMPDGLVVYGTGLRQFAGIEQFEDFLDSLRVVDERG